MSIGKTVLRAPILTRCCESVVCLPEWPNEVSCGTDSAAPLGRALRSLLLYCASVCSVRQ